MRPTLLRHQLEFCDNLEARKLGLVCGFGAGKTHALVAKAITMATLNIGYVSALFEPVAPMLRDILQRTMDDLLEQYGIPHTFRVSPLPEYTLNFAEGSHTILLRTMETWNRIRGQNLCSIGFDEASTANKRVAEQATRMALARLRAGNVRQFYAATTPEGFCWAYETFEKNPGADTVLIRGSSYDNPYLPADFIPSLEANYPPELVRAYVMGHFVSLTTGMVYDRFKREKHVRELPPLLDRFGRPYQDQTPGKPCADETIILGCDFNIGNSNAALYLRRGDDFWCFDEVAKAHDTDDLGRKVRERYPDHRILMYPDASGAKRTTNASRSDIAILEGYGMSNMSPSANPPIRDRIAAAQALLENGKGETHLYVTPNCPKVIDSFELLSYDEKTGLPEKGTYDHMCFTGDTLVATPAGPVRMDALPPEGWVIGPFGVPIRYRNAGLTRRDAPTVTLRIGSRSAVRCTPEHRLLTEAGAWKQAQAVTPGETLACLRSWAHGSSDSVERTTTSAATTINALVCAFTALSGNTSTVGRFLTATMYTTGTATRPITTPTTWSCSRLLSTFLTTATRKLRQSVGTLAWVSGCWGSPLNGTAPRLGRSGTGSTTSRCETSCTRRSSLMPAAPVELSSAAISPMACTAAATVWPQAAAGLALTTWTGSVPSAGLCFGSTAMPESRPAADSAAPCSVGAIEESEKADVYCLTTELGCFALASGLIVSNCDAATYPLHRIRAVENAQAGRKVGSIRLY